MTSNSPPSRNPANNDTLGGVFDLVLTKFLQGVDDQLPAQVIAYNRATNRAQVQILIPVITTDNQLVKRGQIASVPVFQYGGGGFVISANLVAGDLGWLKANDRDISLFKQTLKASPPNTQRKHDFADAMFYPDVMNRTVTIAAGDAGNMVIQNLSGTVKISISNNGIGINGPANAHAALDVQSTTKAFIPPRMTQGQRDAIPSPVEGMVVWNLTAHGLSVYNGSAWS